MGLIQFFLMRRAELEAEFPVLGEALSPGGCLWVSWPKRSSGVETALGEGAVRAFGLGNGPVDVKVISIDKTWSWLKFVLRSLNKH